MSASIDHSQRLTRQEIIDALVERDGLVCCFPGCDKPIILDAPEGPTQTTIEHWYPQSWAKEQGWTYEQIWDLSNLGLAHKKCNAKKGDRIPNDDGTLPEKAVRKFRYRRDKRAGRAEVCEFCQAGRLLGENEWCNACGCGSGPGRFPKWRQMSVKECDHDLFYCVSCTIWFPEKRRSVLDSLMTGGNGYE